VDFSLFKIQDSKLSYAKSLSWIHTAAWDGAIENRGRRRVSKSLISRNFAAKKEPPRKKRNDSQHYEEV
jgi:hypothetical protein